MDNAAIHFLSDQAGRLIVNNKALKNAIKRGQRKTRR